MLCVSFVRYSVVVNNDSVGPIVPRGAFARETFSPLPLYFMCRGLILTYQAC